MSFFFFFFFFFFEGDTPRCGAATCGDPPSGTGRSLLSLPRTRLADDRPTGEMTALMRELNAIEDAHPQLRTPDSPTQKVERSYSTLFTPVTHL